MLVLRVQVDWWCLWCNSQPVYPQHHHNYDFTLLTHPLHTITTIITHSWVLAVITCDSSFKQIRQQPRLAAGEDLNIIEKDFTFSFLFLKYNFLEKTNKLLKKLQLHLRCNQSVASAWPLLFEILRCLMIVWNVWVFSVISGSTSVWATEQSLIHDLNISVALHQLLNNEIWPTFHSKFDKLVQTKVNVKN